MTYLELADKISRMTKEQAYSEVMIHLSSKDEYYKVDHIDITDENEEDRLEDGYPALIVGDDWE